MYGMRLCLALAWSLSALADYTTEDEGVVVLTSDNFKTLVTDTDELWLVEFYAPWCGHCKTLEPEWKKFGKAVKGFVNVGAVDMDAHAQVGAPYEVTGFPTIKAILPGGESSNYDGKRTASGLAAWAIKTVKEVVKSRLGIKSAPKDGAKAADDGTKVVTLSDENFGTAVLESSDFWLVEFYAPWCGHCKSLAPEWKKAAAQLDGKAKLGAVDCTVNPKTCEKFEVKGYPTIKVFDAEDKSDVEDYNGRAAKDIVEFVSVRAGIEIEPTPKPEAKKPKKSKSSVVELTEANFESEVYGSESIWLVEFFAPWCGHCKNLAPHWKKAAKQLEATHSGKVKLGEVDATIHTSLAQQFGVTGYPTIKVFLAGASEYGEPQDYKGGRTTETIVQEATRLLGGDSAEEDEGETASIVLTDSNFDSEVIESDDLWLIEFFAPWCGHCKNLAPHWKKASVALDGKVKLGTVDCTGAENTATKDKYQITGFPTLAFFSRGERFAYDGTMLEDGIISKCLEQLEEHQKLPREVKQLTSQKIYDEECGVGLCVVAILPHILDTGADGRNTYLSYLKDQAVAFKRSQIGFVWTGPFEQEKMESSLDISGSGYPALAVINQKKGRYVRFLSTFSSESLTSFLTRVVAQKERSGPLPSFSLVTSESWDGQDGQLPQEHDEL